MLIAIGKAILECPCWTVAFRAGEMNPRWRADSLLLSFLIIAASAETLQLSAGLAVCYSRSSNNLTAFNISLLSTLDCWGKLKNIVAERRVQSAGCRMRDAWCRMLALGWSICCFISASCCSAILMMDCAESVLSSHARTLQIKVFKCRLCRRIEKIV